MKLSLTLIAILPALLAQQPPAPPQSPTPAAASPPPAAAPTADTSPAPAESWLTGSIDLGYRFSTGVGGSFDAYRSIVNLGEGPKLLGADFTLTDPRHRLFDQVRVRATTWGGEPYSTFHLDAGKAKRYVFNADYRDVAYFNFLPSYADPLLGRGIVLNEQSFDTRRRAASFRLELLPGNWFVPYLAYDNDSGSGTGATAFVSDANEYPVPTNLRDSTHLYRGGVRFELRRFHVTLEQGGTTFKDDQNLFQNSGVQNPGNALTPVFGETLSLNNLLAAYGVRGTSVYSKGLMTASPASWIDLYGQFLYSQPDSNVHYQHAATGNLFAQDQLLFYTGEAYLLTAAGKLPHTTASFGAEIRPLHRLRIVESWMTDRMHSAGSSTSTLALSGPGVSEQTAALLASSLANNYNQQEIDAFFDATSKLTFRGGYRYVWGDANYAVLPAEGLVSSDQGKLRRHVALGSVSFRPNHKLWISGNIEGASSSGVYFRTSLYNYQQFRAQVRYEISSSLNVAADFSLLNNQNPTAGIKYDYLARQESFSLFWSPGGGKVWSVEGSYTRSDLRSDIGYLSPQDFQSQTSSYRDNSNTATALLNAKLPSRAPFALKMTAGGSLFVSSGSRPTRYYQPLASLWLPLGKHVNWFAEWRYYGYGETFYLYEGFRSHLVTTGLRFSR